MCPSIINSSQVEEDIDILEANFVFYVDVFTSSSEPVYYTISIELVEQFVIRYNVVCVCLCLCMCVCTCIVSYFMYACIIIVFAWGRILEITECFFFFCKAVVWNSK